jgi:PAS domain S-box-containing protein
MTAKNPQSFRRHSVIAPIAGMVAALMGGGALLGWWLSNEGLKSIVPGSSPMKPNIAAGMLLCGGVLVLLSLTRSAKPTRVGAAAAGIIVLVLGGLTLGEHFLGWNLGIDGWLIRSGANETSQMLRMAPSTALCFVLTGAMFFGQSGWLSRRLSLALVTGLSAALVFIGMVAMAGFCLELLVGPRWNLMGMSLSGVTAAVGFLLLGAGLLALMQSQGQLVWSLDGFTTTGFAIGMLLVVVAAAMAFSYTRRMLETTTWLSHRQEVLGKVQELYADMSELASAHRVYIITGDEQLLKAREQLKAKAADDAASVRKLTSDNPNQQHRLDLLEPLIRQRIEWEEQVTGIRRNEGFPAAAQLMGTGKGVNLSAEIIRLLNQMEQEEYQLLGQHRKQAETASATAFSILPFGVFLSLAVLALGLSFLNAGVGERAEAEGALRQSEERMRTVLESALDSIIAMDHQGRILEFNPAAEKTFGYQRREAIGKVLADLIIPARLRERHQRGLSHYLATGEGPVLGKRIEMMAMRADSSEFPVELAITRIGSQDPPMFTGFIRDITERKQAEEMLRSSEERYRSLFESNPNPMWVYDTETLSFLAVNAAAIRHYGFTGKEFMAMTLRDIRPPEDLPALMVNLSKTGQELDETTKWRHRKKDGGLIDVEISSHELMWLGRHARLVLINDITARKQAEEVRAQLAAIIETSDDAIIGKNLDGIITSWNRGAEKLFGYSASEAIGQSMLMLFPPDLVGEETGFLGRIRHGEEIDHFDTVRVTKSGKRIDVSVTLSPILDQAGQIIGASKIARDITERKRAEQEIRQLNAELEDRVLRRTAELESANKELEAFSYSVSHDLRSPLRTVDGFSQAVLEDYGPQLPDEGRRYLQTIRDGAQRMGVLIDDLLTFSRLSRLPLHKQNVDMARMARDTFAELDSEKAGRKIELKIGALPKVHGDPALLKQVWVNLLSNAMKYTRKREMAVIEVGSRRENGSAVCFVTDNGTGFDMQYAHKLFGVFQRLHRADEFEGTGVGLAIVKRVINRHGGRVWAESTKGKGATFYFTLEGAKQKV